MTTRHRVPSIFNIYMVDVLCCALGCVILLWQLYYQDAQDQQALAQNLQGQLQEATLALDRAKTDTAALVQALETSHKKQGLLSLDLAKFQGERDLAGKMAAQARQELADSRQSLAATEKLLASLRQEHQALEAKRQRSAVELGKKTQAHDDLLTRLANTDQRLRHLEQDLSRKQATVLDSLQLVGQRTTQLQKAELLSRQLQQQLAEFQQESKTYQGQLAAAELNSRKLEKQLASLQQEARDNQGKLVTAELNSRKLEKQLASLQQEARDNQGKLVTAELRTRLLTRDLEQGQKMLTGQAKDLAEARDQIASLQGEKVGLLKQAQQVRQAAEQRFAGITLTGQRVVLLIDMSGSMVMLDENTELPDKWPLVCATIGRLLASLPDLQHYQVILFSDKVRYPFGQEGRWLTYDPQNSTRDLVAGLQKIKPSGETNMYAAFAEAFRYRPLGLDTIYIFSDGLPNAGPGAPADSQLAEPQRTKLLTQHLRQQLRTVWNRPASEQRRVRINAIGFFFESPDVGAFLWALTREHQGSFVGMSQP